MTELSNDTAKKPTFLQRVKKALKPNENSFLIVSAVSVIAFLETPAFVGVLGVGKAILTAGAAYGVGMLGVITAGALGGEIGGRISKIFSKSEKAHAIGTIAGAIVLGLPAGFFCAHHAYEGTKSLLSSDNKPVTEIFNKTSAPVADAKTLVLTPKTWATYAP